MFTIETKRLIIKEFTLDMAYDVHINSLDIDNRRFVPDEVFETIDEAKETIEFLIQQYDKKDGPFVYPIFIKETNTNIGYIQMIKLDSTFEIGYHIAKKYTGNGYAKEAVNAFLPIITKKLGIHEVLGICLKENIASMSVLKSTGFIKIYEGLGLYQGEEREIFKSIWKR
jgi:RimJ/RimL family protein N-acetyltransferase